MTNTLRNEGRVVLNIPSVEMLLFSLKFDQLSPNASESPLYEMKKPKSGRGSDNNRRQQDRLK